MTLRRILLPLALLPCKICRIVGTNILPVPDLRLDTAIGRQLRGLNIVRPHYQFFGRLALENSTLAVKLLADSTIRGENAYRNGNPTVGPTMSGRESVTTLPIFL